MKKKNLKLGELNVTSFRTSLDKIKGGLTNVTVSFNPDDCHIDPTTECPTDSDPLNTAAEGQYGICQAPSKACSRRCL